MDITFAGQSGDKWTYHTDQILGRGGFGSVYAAEDAAGAPVAVKIVDKGRFSGVLSDRLLRREIEIGRKVRDSGGDLLLPVIDVAETSDALLLVMSRAGAPLSASLPMSEPDAIAALIDVVTGLQQLHLAGIIHRDLKPPNVLQHAGYWKLADFGIARDQEIGTQDPTFAGAGSVPYMAPELWQLKSPTVKTDLYALGCLGFELLAGAPPYGGDLTAVREAHLAAPPPEAPYRDPVVSNLIYRLLAKDPADRPQDARAVLERLAKAAVPRTPAQEAIARGLGGHHAEKSRAAAVAAAQRAAADEIRAQVSQGKADLLEIFTDVLVDLQAVEPDAVVEPSSSRGVGTPWHSLRLAAAGVLLDVRIWPDAQLHRLSPKDTMLIAGEVNISNPRHYPFSCANIVYEQVEGRFAWQVYRFCDRLSWIRLSRNAYRRNHGINQHEFLDADRRRQMIRGRMADWKIAVDLLTADTVLKLFQEAIDLPARSFQAG